MSNLSIETKKFMLRAVELSKKNWGLTGENPSVGAVLVKNGKIIKEAVTSYNGRPHAEAILLRNKIFEKADLYVTLEPCCHFGKTPPCTSFIINSKIKRVFVGIKDPNPIVNGKGLKILKSAKIEVFNNILPEECAEPNEWFFKRFKSEFPYITIKTAISLDGKIATSTGISRWISSKKSRIFTQTLRKRHHAIMVGTNTILKDNPSLTIHEKNIIKQPDRIILDPDGILSPSFNVFKKHINERVFYFTGSKKTEKKFKNLNHVKIFYLPKKNCFLDILKIMKILKEEKVWSILVEGGGTLNASIIENNLVDRLYVVISPRLIGGKDAPTLFDGTGFKNLSKTPLLKNVEYIQSEQDIIITGFLKRYF